MRQNHLTPKLARLAGAVLFVIILATPPLFAGNIGFNPATQQVLITEGTKPKDVTFTFVNGGTGGVDISGVSFSFTALQVFDGTDNATGKFKKTDCEGTIAAGKSCTYIVTVSTDKADIGPIDEWEGDLQVQLSVTGVKNPYTGDADVWVSDVEPEPATITLVGSGLALVGTRLRRKQRS